MGKRGPKPKRIVNETWNPNLAYAIGLIATDGCLSKDGLLIDLTSKDREQLENFSKCLGVKFNIGNKRNANGDKHLRIQFKNRIFYDFLISIGLTPKKSLTLGELAIPDKYFFDFLRGSFDGDGSFYSYFDKRWKLSFMFYTSFASASKKHMDWLRKKIYFLLKIKGHISKARNSSVFQLKYAKSDSKLILREMYKNRQSISLSRKRLKIKDVFSSMGMKGVIK